jgi:hypothetical protein
MHTRFDTRFVCVLVLAESLSTEVSAVRIIGLTAHWRIANMEGRMLSQIIFFGGQMGVDRGIPDAALDVGFPWADPAPKAGTLRVLSRLSTNDSPFVLGSNRLAVG